MTIDATKLARASTQPVVSTGLSHLPMKRNDKFTLAHFPTEWELVKTKEGSIGPKGEDPEYTWLPRLKKLEWRPGVNGVRKRGKVVDTSLAETDYRRRGFTLVETHVFPMEGPQGLPDGGYRLEYPGIGGIVYLCRWEIPKVFAGTCTIKVDQDYYNNFRRRLIEAGIIAAPDPDALDMLVERFHTRIKRHAKRAHIPAVKAEIDAMAANIEHAKTASRPSRNAHAF